MAVKEQRKKVHAAVYLVLVDGDRVLLLRRFQTGYQDGNYSLPAGHIDGEEPASVALLREAREEVGLELTLDELTFRHVLHRSSADDREYSDYFFSAELAHHQPFNAEPDKCDDLSWFPGDDLPSNMVPAVRQVLTHIFSNGPVYSEFGW